MKIGHLDKKPEVTPVTKERKASVASTATGTATPASSTEGTEASAQVELSSAATALAAGDTATPEFDSEKVGRIAQAIREGKFKVNPEAIADKLITNAQEILGRTSH